MFIAIVLITIGFIGLLTYRDWVQNNRISTKDCERILTSISKLIILEEWQEAKKQVLSLINKKKGGNRAILLYIQVLRGTKEFEKALNLATTCDEPSFQLEKGKILLQLNQPKKALEAFLAAQNLIADESDFFDLALAYLRAGFPDKCWAIVEPRLNNSAFSLAIGAECLLEQKQYQRSLELYEKAIKCGWNSHHLQTQIGSLHRNLGNFALSETIYRRILEKDSGDVVATLGLGACMQEKGLYQKALLIYQSGDAWQKKDPRILKQAALMALYTQRYEFAESYFAELITLEKHSSELYSYYGYCMEMQEKWHEAENIYQAQREQFPTDPKSYLATAWLFGVGFSTITAEQGLNYANIALQMKPDHLSYEILSACEARAGNFESAYAIQEYLATLDKSPDERKRRQTLLKTLRKNLPLDNQLLRRLVA